MAKQDQQENLPEGQNSEAEQRPPQIPDEIIPEEIPIEAAQVISELMKYATAPSAYKRRIDKMAASCEEIALRWGAA